IMARFNKDRQNDDISVFDFHSKLRPERQRREVILKSIIDYDFAGSTVNDELFKRIYSQPSVEPLAITTTEKTPGIPIRLFPFNTSTLTETHGSYSPLLGQDNHPILRHR